MNMDQILVLTYTDRNHKTRVISESEFYEMFVCENNRGRILNDEEEWLEQFNGEFNYVTFYQAVINGDLNDFQAVQEELNDHWTSRNEKGVDGVYAFVNAGVLDRSMFNEHTFDTEPRDFQVWMKARQFNYMPGSTMEQTLAKLKAAQVDRGDSAAVQIDENGEMSIVVEKTSTRKPWVL